MCGILGYISNESIDDFELNEMLDAMNHRGPDGRGIKKFYSNNDTYLSFGHVRLSILDLSELGAQPMVYKDRYWVTYNGEIYNFKELKEELIQKKYTFTSETDTEVLLAAYSEWGPECLNKLNGMFAFSIFDSLQNEIFIARDRFGVKPLYYFKHKNTFAFASEIKSLMANNDINHVVEPNIHECSNYLKKGPQVWREETLFSHIKRFPKASFYKGSLEGLLEDKIALRTYYQIPRHDEYQISSDEELIQKYRELFSSAVKLRLRADVDIGTALSGGLDSSSIAYFINKKLRQENSSEKQKTFSSVYTNANYSRYDESKYIDSVANTLDVNSHKVDIEMDLMLKEYEKVIWAHDCPPEGMPIQGWMTYRLVKENGVTISIDGQGADEQLAGYETYLINHLSHMPLSEFLVEIQKIKNFPYPTRQIFLIYFFFILNYLKLAKPVSYLMKIILGSSFDPTNKLQEILSRTFHENLMTLLFHGDKQSMAWSVETRLPYMDFRIVEFLANIHDGLKIKDGWTKYINRKAVEGLVPDDVVWRKNKLGWPVPEKEWLEGDLKPWADNIIHRSNFLRKVSRMDIFFYLNRGKTKFKIRQLNLAIWHKLFFENHKDL